MSSVPLANWNGDFLPLDEVKVSVLDRAFLFGDAVYEGMRVYQGRIFLADRHFARLRHSLDQLKIRADVGRVRRRAIQTIQASGELEGLLYLQITRGAGSKRTHAFPPPSVQPNELIFLSAYSDGDPYRNDREAGVKVVTHPDLRWARRDIKTVNLLGNCLAAQAAKEAGAYEAVLFEENGEMTEGSHTSAFGVLDGKLRTSPLGPHILPGVTRAFVLELAEREGIDVDQRPLFRSDLTRLDEFFLTGTSTEVLGVNTIDGARVGSGVVGPTTRRLASAFRRSVEEWLATQEG